MTLPAAFIFWFLGLGFGFQLLSELFIVIALLLKILVFLSLFFKIILLLLTY